MQVIIVDGFLVFLDLVILLLLNEIIAVAVKVQPLRQNAAALLLCCSEPLLLLEVVAYLLVGLFNFLAEKLSRSVRVVLHDVAIRVIAIRVTGVSCRLKTSCSRLLVIDRYWSESRLLMVQKNGGRHARVRGRLIPLLVRSVSCLLIACAEKHLRLVRASHW